jgi:hypothetical protein
MELRTAVSLLATDDALSHRFRGQTKGLKHAFSFTRFPEHSEQNMPVSDLLGLQRLRFSVREVYDLVSFARERDNSVLIALRLGIPATTQRLQFLTRPAQGESERVQGFSDRTGARAVAGPRANDGKEQVFGSYRRLTKAPRLILGQSEHTLRAVVIEAEASGHVQT